LVRGRSVTVLEFVGRPPAGVVVVISEHGGGGAECVGAGECAALGGSGGGGDEGLDEFVRDAVQAVHCLCTADADPVQIGDLGGHRVGDHVGVTVWGAAGEGVSVFVMAVPGCGGANPCRGMARSVQSRSLLGIMGRSGRRGGWSVVRVSAWNTEES